MCLIWTFFSCVDQSIQTCKLKCAAHAAVSAAKVEPKVADTVAMWFSNRADPMEKHANRNSSGVGKYLVLDSRVEKGLATNTEKDLPPEELEYASVTQRTKKLRTSLDGSIF